jgi:hypothetical protein
VTRQREWCAKVGYLQKESGSQDMSGDYSVRAGIFLVRGRVRVEDLKEGGVGKRWGGGRGLLGRSYFFVMCIPAREVFGDKRHRVEISKFDYAPAYQMCRMPRGQ